MRWLFPLLVAVAAPVGCTHHHQARVAPTTLPPPPVEMVAHSGRLWIELEGTPDRQCSQVEGRRPLCFAGLSEALGKSIERTLWPAFPGVAVKRKGDNLEPGDYLLHVVLAMQPLPADEQGPGWSAAGRAEWTLVRDGLPLASERVASRSRSEFPYGHSLGVGAGEVVSSIAVHVASVVGGLPEMRPVAGVPLPPVASEARTGPLFAARAAECQSSDDAKRCSMASR